MSAVEAPGSRTGFGWMIAVAGAAFVLFLAAVAYQPELSAARDKGAHALSRSPVGYAAVVELLREDGAEVSFNRRPLERTPVSARGLLVLTPASLTTAVTTEVAAAARRHRVLLVPPKWFTVPDPQRSGRVLRAGETPPGDVRALAQAVLAQQPGDGRVALRWDGGAHALTLAEPGGLHDLGFSPARVKPILRLRTLSGEAVQPLLTDGEGRAVLAIGAARNDYVLADADVIANQGVADLAGARAAVSLLEGLADGGPISFDLTLAGVAGQRNLLKLLFEPPFAAATLCAVLLAALTGLSARTRFGALRRPPRAYAFGKRALADSAASLLALAGREPRLADRYADVLRADAAAAVGLAPASSPQLQDATLDRIGLERGAESWAELAREAPGLKTRGELMAWARRAGAWRTEMTRGRG